MLINRISFQGYRSLRNVMIDLGPRTVLIGPNNAGKSNIVDAIAFYIEMMTFNPDVAINNQRGGFQHLVCRGLAPDEQAISIRVDATLTPAEVMPYELLDDLTPKPRLKDRIVEAFRVSHELTLRPVPANNLTGFSIEKERFVISVQTTEQLFESIVVNGILAGRQLNEDLLNYLRVSSFWPQSVWEGFLSPGRPQTELRINRLQPFSPVTMAFQRNLKQSKIYRLDPFASRAPGAPTLAGDISASGRDLPALVSFLQLAHPESWEHVRQWLKLVVPSMESVEIRSDHDRRLRIEFVETDAKQRWSDQDVSDGTIRSLALYAALADPRWHFQAFEAPENSLHAWAIRSFLDACREATSDPTSKQVLLTTHSPVLIDALAPEEIAIVWQEEGATRVRPLIELDKSVREFWASGDGKISDLLDTGLIDQAVPVSGR